MCLLITTVAPSTFNFPLILIEEDVGARLSAMWNQQARAQGVDEHYTDRTHWAGPKFLSQVKHLS